MLGLRFCARAFSSCRERGPLFIAVRGPLTVAASLVAEHKLQTCRLSSCGSRAQLLRGMWDLPRPGLEPVSSALAGRFSTTAPPGKPQGPWSYFQVFLLGQVRKLLWTQWLDKCLLLTLSLEPKDWFEKGRENLDGRGGEEVTCFPADELGGVRERRWLHRG